MDRGDRKVAFLFPGQEAALPGAGLELAERSVAARELLRLASELSGVDVVKLLTRGGAALGRSAVMQPTLVAVSLGALAELLAAGIEPDAVAGLSLGEISAWCGAGCVEASNAVEVAAIRGRVMGEVSERRPGGMVALRVSGEDEVEAALRVGRPKGLVVVASRNAPDEIVLSGEEAALRAVAAAHPSTRLPTPGPWHTALMEEGVEEVRRALERVPHSPPRADFVCNRTGEVVDEADRIPELLAGQLTHSVAWARSLNTLAAAGVTDYVAVGPAKVVRSLLRRTLGASPRVHTTDDARDLSATVEALGR